MSATAHWLKQRIDMTPEAIALVDVDQQITWTYKELEHRILHWSTIFQSASLVVGNRVALFAQNSIETFAVLFACNLYGLLFTPLNTRLHHHEIQAILEDAEPSLVIIDQEAKGIIDEIQWNVYIWKSPEILDRMVSNLSWEINPELPAVMIYTGGTTGLPKGVLLSNRAIEWNAINTLISWGLTGQDRTLNYMPLFHTGGLNALAIPLLMAGGQVFIGNKFDADKVIEELADHHITIALFVPTMYQMMIQTGKLANKEFPAMKSFLSGGAPCALSIYHYFELHNLPFKQGYGLSEAGPNNFMMPQNISQFYKGSVGKPMIYAHIDLFDDEGLKIHAPHEAGEIWIHGPHLFSGYWKRAKETKMAFENGWFKTGDLAKRDEHGNYYIIGRKKDIIISGGENIYPQEIEIVLNQLKGISDQAVLGCLDEKWGEVPVAFVTVNDATLPVEEIYNHCIKHLSKYKCPAQIHILQELPKTSVGKLDKRKLQEYITARVVEPYSPF